MKPQEAYTADEYIRKDGTTDTTDSIPFQHGISTAGIKPHSGDSVPVTKGLKIKNQNSQVSITVLEQDPVLGVPVIVFEDEPTGVKTKMVMLGGSEFNIVLYDEAGHAVNSLRMNTGSENEYQGDHHKFYLPTQGVPSEKARLVISNHGFGYGRNADWNGPGVTPNGFDIRDDAKFIGNFGIHGHAPTPQYMNSAGNVQAGNVYGETEKKMLNDVYNALLSKGVSRN